MVLADPNFLERAVVMGSVGCLGILTIGVNCLCFGRHLFQHLTSHYSRCLKNAELAITAAVHKRWKRVNKAFNVAAIIDRCASPGSPDSDPLRSPLFGTKLSPDFGRQMTPESPTDVVASSSKAL